MQYMVQKDDMMHKRVFTMREEGFEREEKDTHFCLYLFSANQELCGFDCVTRKGLKTTAEITFLAKSTESL